MEERDLVILSEAARRLGLAPSTLHVYKQRYEDFPKPALKSGSVVLYDYEELERWHRDLRGVA